MGQIYDRDRGRGSGPTRGLDNQTKTRTKGNGALGGSVEIGGYEKGQCAWERSLERLRIVLLKKRLSYVYWTVHHLDS